MRVAFLPKIIRDLGAYLMSSYGTKSNLACLRWRSEAAVKSLERRAQLNPDILHVAYSMT